MIIKKILIFVLFFCLGNLDALKVGNRRPGKANISKLSQSRTGKASIKAFSRSRKGSSKLLNWCSNASFSKKLVIGGSCLATLGLTVGGARSALNYYYDNPQVQLFAYQKSYTNIPVAVEISNGNIIADNTEKINICGFDWINQVFVRSSFDPNHPLLTLSQIHEEKLLKNEVAKFVRLDFIYGISDFIYFIKPKELNYLVRNIYLNLEDGCIYYFVKELKCGMTDGIPSSDSYFGLLELSTPNNVDFYSINNKKEFFDYFPDEKMDYYLSSKDKPADLSYKPVTFKVNFGERAVQGVEDLISRLVNKYIKQHDRFYKNLSRMKHQEINHLADYSKFENIFERKMWNECIGINHLEFLLNQSQVTRLKLSDIRSEYLSRQHLPDGMDFD